MIVTVILPDENMKFDCEVVLYSHFADVKIKYGYEDGIDMALDRWEAIAPLCRHRIQREAIRIAQARLAVEYHA